MPAKKRMIGRLPEVRITDAVKRALEALAARYPERSAAEIIRAAIIEYEKALREMEKK